MNKQNGSIVPDYILVQHEINDASLSTNQNNEQRNNSSNSSSLSSSSKKFQQYATIVNEPSISPLKSKLNPYASTDEDVDEFNLDYSDDIERSTTTIQTYRDRLNVRLNSESNEFGTSRPRILSTECSQITFDSGVDIASEQKMFQQKTDEQYSEQTANQNDLFALSDDSLLDIESPQSHELLVRTPPIINEQSTSFSEESDGGKSYLTAITGSPLISKSERGRSNASDQYHAQHLDTQS